MKSNTMVFVITVNVFLSVFARTSICDEHWPATEWRVSPPETQGMNPSLASTVEEYVRGNNITVSSLLVVRNGCIVFEQYYECGEKDLHFLMSETKSVLSILVGIAIQNNSIRGIDQKIADFFPK
jgi:hypothetical protein